MTVECLKFLSTPSARRATCFRWTNSQSSWVFLSTPSARRATCFQDAVDVVPLAFLSTPSARRATACIAAKGSTMPDFYPRPPRGGRRDFLLQLGICLLISIHALREEGDGRSAGLRIYTHRFLSTPSARRATRNGSWAKR